MPIFAKNVGGSDGVQHQPIPAGTYLARCYSMIELGTLNEVILGTEKLVHKVRITFELPTELRVFNPEKGEQPCVISKEFSLSMGENSNLRKFLTSWRGKPFTEEEAKLFEVTRLLGVPCLLTVIHKQGKKDPSRFYDEIGTVSPLMKGMTCPPQVNPTLEFELGAFDQEKFNNLPNFLQEKIRSSQEYRAMFPAQAAMPRPVAPVQATMGSKPVAPAAPDYDPFGPPSTLTPSQQAQMHYTAQAAMQDDEEENLPF